MNFIIDMIEWHAPKLCTEWEQTEHKEIERERERENKTKRVENLLMDWNIIRNRLMTYISDSFGYHSIHYRLPLRGKIWIDWTVIYYNKWNWLNAITEQRVCVCVFIIILSMLYYIKYFIRKDGKKSMVRFMELFLFVSEVSETCKRSRRSCQIKTPTRNIYNIGTRIK